MTAPQQFAAPPARFYDAFDWRNLPRRSNICLYVDGDAPIPTVADLARLEPVDHRGITVTGNYRAASILDGRPDNNVTDAQTRAFVRGRKASNYDAIMYSPRAFVAEVQRALLDSGAAHLLDYPGLWWWIPTLDGRQWTAEELADDLAANWGAIVEPSRIWANQWGQIPHLGPGAIADISNLFMAFRP